MCKHYYSIIIPILYWIFTALVLVLYSILVIKIFSHKQSKASLKARLLMSMILNVICSVSSVFYFTTQFLALSRIDPASYVAYLKIQASLDPTFYALSLVFLVLVDYPDSLKPFQRPSFGKSK